MVPALRWPWIRGNHDSVEVIFVLVCRPPGRPGLKKDHRHRASSHFVLTQNYLPSNLTRGFEFRTVWSPIRFQTGREIWANELVCGRLRTIPEAGILRDGFVSYVDGATAESQGLIKVMRNRLFLGVDNKSILDTTAQGRNSIRLESTETWSSGLLIADFAHMPGNQCGVWPAL